MGILTVRRNEASTEAMEGHEWKLCFRKCPMKPTCDIRLPDGVSSTGWKSTVKLFLAALSFGNSSSVRLTATLAGLYQNEVG